MKRTTNFMALALLVITASASANDAATATGMLASLKEKAMAAKSTVANGLSSAWSTVANSAVVTKANELAQSGTTSVKNGFEISKEFTNKHASIAKAKWNVLVASIKGGSTTSLNALNNGFENVKTFAVEHPYKTTAITAGVVVTTVAAYKLISNYFAKKNTDNAQAA